MRTTILGSAVLSIAALTLTQLAPANADGIGVSDPQDLGHGVAGTRPDGKDSRTDWLGEPRSFTDWVAK